MTELFKLLLPNRYIIFLFLMVTYLNGQAQLRYSLVDKFHFPVGNTEQVTPQRDGDGWYDAQPFRVNNHLGEDWNAETGGNSDCGATVFAVANGVCIYSKDAGGGWGNVIIIRHLLPSGDLVETLYAHLEKRLIKEGEKVFARELVGYVGDGEAPCGNSAPYYAHLHFELRNEDCRHFGQVGGGYSAEQKGWLSPTKFILQHQ